MGNQRREVARALLFDEDDRILMVHWRDPATGHEFVEPPGGLREAGESFEDALRREIAEETGLTQVDVVDLVTEIDHRFTFGGEDYDCRERYFACRLSGPRMAPPSRDAVEQAGMIGVAWLDVADLAARPPDQVEPPELLEMLRRLGRFGARPGADDASDG